jgi:hypothetical protein
LLYWGISSCMPMSKKSAACELSHVLTPSINSLLFKCCDHNQLIIQVGKQVVVAWSEIRTVRRVIQQLPVEMLQQCSSASSCPHMRTHIDMEEHYTTPIFLNGPVQFFLMFRNAKHGWSHRRHTKTYSLMWQMPQFRQRLCWEVG